MDKQAIFSKTRAHLLKQGKKSLALSSVGGSFERSCAYRGENGTMCAIGCHIPDKDYAGQMEGLSAYALYEKYSEVMSRVFDTGIVPSSADGLFLRALQRIHDFVDVAGWPAALADFAETYKLKDE